jgi:hypothetical protein
VPLFTPREALNLGTSLNKKSAQEVLDSVSSEDDPCEAAYNILSASSFAPFLSKLELHFACERAEIVTLYKGQNLNVISSSASVGCMPHSN